MKPVVSILCALFSSALLLQLYFAIWNPSSFGRFAELPVILVVASIPVAMCFAAAIPLCWWLQRAGYRMTWPVASVVGIILSVVVQIVFLSAIGWPIRMPEIVAAATGGAIGLGAYKKLAPPPVKAESSALPNRDSRNV
jgi:hypothetical protein